MALSETFPMLFSAIAAVSVILVSLMWANES